MKNALPVCGALLAVLLAGCAREMDTREADVRSLKDNEAQWNQEFVSKDAEKLVAHYADDAILMAPGMPPSSGKDAIRKTIKEMVSDPALALRFQAARVEVARSGDVGYTQGSYTMMFTDPASKKIVTDHGSYVTTYRKQADGTWKAIADIASSEAPPAMPTESAAK